MSFQAIEGDVVLRDASGNAVGVVLDGVVYRLQTEAKVTNFPAVQPVSDNGGSLTVDGSVSVANFPPVQPVSATALPLPTGAATEATLANVQTDTSNLNVGLSTRLSEATFAARINTLGQKLMGASTPVAIASDQSAVPVTDNGGSLTVDTPQLPPSLVGGRLDGNLGAWLGSTAPTVGQKASANCLPVVLASDQSSISVTLNPSGSRTGVSSGYLVLGGSTSGNEFLVMGTPYTEPTSEGQRSLVSSSANDAAAGTGARAVTIVYYDNSGNGPLFETVTLNGTSPVNTVATNIRFIERMEVQSSGSLAANAGTISLYSAVGGGGSVIGTIGYGTIVLGKGDNQTLWAHHYVAAGYSGALAVFVVSITSQGNPTNGRFYIKASRPLLATTTDLIIGGVIQVGGQFQRSYDFNPLVTGFARLNAYAIPGVNNSLINASFDWSEVAV